MELVKCCADPSRCCLCGKTLAPILLCESESQVNPAVVLQNEQPGISDGNSRIAVQNEPFAETMRLLVVYESNQSRFCLLNGLIRSRGSKSHDDGVTKPTKCCLGVRKLEWPKDKSVSFNLSLHIVARALCRL